jgi:hypothetical protein
MKISVDVGGVGGEPTRSHVTRNRRDSGVTPITQVCMYKSLTTYQIIIKQVVTA